MEKQAEIRFNGSQWPQAHAHAPWVEEIWRNYLNNALQYGGTPPAIVLGASCDDGQVTYWISDNGAGLDAEARAELFQPFIRF